MHFPRVLVALWFALLVPAVPASAQLPSIVQPGTLRVPLYDVARPPAPGTGFDTRDRAFKDRIASARPEVVTGLAYDYLVQIDESTAGRFAYEPWSTKPDADVALHERRTDVPVTGNFPSRSRLVAFRVLILIRTRAEDVRTQEAERTRITEAFRSVRTAEAYLERYGDVALSTIHHGAAFEAEFRFEYASLDQARAARELALPGIWTGLGTEGLASWVNRQAGLESLAIVLQTPGEPHPELFLQLLDFQERLDQLKAIAVDQPRLILATGAYLDELATDSAVNFDELRQQAAHARYAQKIQARIEHLLRTVRYLQKNPRLSRDTEIDFGATEKELSNLLEETRDALKGIHANRTRKELLPHANRLGTLALALEAIAARSLWYQRPVEFSAKSGSAMVWTGSDSEFGPPPYALRLRASARMDHTQRGLIVALTHDQKELDGDTQARFTRTYLVPVPEVFRQLPTGAWPPVKAYSLTEDRWEPNVQAARRLVIEPDREGWRTLRFVVGRENARDETKVIGMEAAIARDLWVSTSLGRITVP